MAASSSSFDAMLKRYMPNELLIEEIKRKNYFWNTVKKTEGWKGGPMELPFEAGEYSSLSMGALTAATDVAEASEVMGLISVQPELWGTMLFNEKDLDRHSGDMEASYLDLAPGKVNQFCTRLSERVSISLLGDGSIAKATATGVVGGTIAVDNPERFSINEKITLKDGSTVSGYITAIDQNTKLITVKTARSAGSAVDLSTYTSATKIYLPGSDTSGFTGLKSQLLSATNGGSANLFGVPKTSAPFLQALNHDGTTIDANNIVESLFDYFYETMRVGKGAPTEILCSFKHFKNIVKVLNSAREFQTNDKSAGYGFSSINILGNGGSMKITGLRDMADSEIYILDWSAMEFYGDQWMEKARHDGREYFLVRNTTGYQYVVDVKFYGDLVVHHPSHCAIIQGISYT